jgi:diguanylate cyclase (GGDEF)-like protein
MREGRMMDDRGGGRAPQAPDAGATPYTDRLTGLGNRRRLCERVETLAAERADDPAPFTIGIANLDGFKPINDLFGHAAGDVILTQVAHRLRAAMADGALVTRLEHDEFGFVLPLVFERKGAEKMARLLKEVMSAPFDLGNRTVRLSASFGFAVYPFAGDNFDDLMKSADTALYRSKRRGRGQVTVYSEELAEEYHRATELEQALRRAIITDSVDVHFQPIVNLVTGRILGFEALARWNDSELGFVPPTVFIQLAEERGFIDTLTEVLLKKAARAAARWPRDLFLSFNLSSAQLIDLTASLNILAVINRVGLDPRRLELEITETAMMTDPDMARKIIDELRAVGIRVSLDDFGTGQSSLGRLREFSFDKVKIDRAFVSEITRDRPSEHIIKAILAMCDGLNLKVVAEGIEEESQAEKLIAFGCEAGQGYLYGRPVSAEQTQTLLERHYAVRSQSL